MVRKYGRPISSVKSDKDNTRFLGDAVRKYLSDIKFSSVEDELVKSLYIEWANSNGIDTSKLIFNSDIASSIWDNRNKLPRHIRGKLDSYAVNYFLKRDAARLLDTILTASIGLDMEEDCTKSSIRLSYELYHERGY